MTASSSSKGPIVGIVLLLVVVGGVVGTLMFLKSPEQKDVESTPVVVSQKSPDNPLDPTRVMSTDPQKSPEGTTITVVCMGPEGAADPLAGVEILVAPTQGSFTKNELAFTRKTDASGTVVLEDLEYETYAITASPPEYYPLKVHGIRSGARVPFVFQNGIPVTGVVKNQEGQVLAGVNVRIRSGLQGELVGTRVRQAIQRGQDVLDVEGADQIHPHLYMTTETDDSGRFQFAIVPSDYRVKLGIFHPDYDPFEQDLVTLRVDHIDGEYILLPRAEIFGRVVDDKTGEVLEGVLVQATENGIPIEQIEIMGGNTDVYESVSGADGTYRLTGVPRGRQMVQVTHPGYDKFQEIWNLTTLEPYELEIRLKRGATLAGRVVDTSGRPVEGAVCMWAYPEVLILGARALNSLSSVTTGPDGRFAFDGCPVERPFHILVQHPDYVEGRNENVLLQAGENLTGVEVVLASGGSISGVVQTTSQRPVQGATLTARSVKPPGPALNAVVSGPDGTFTIYNTRPGTYEVTCEADGFCSITNRNVSDVATGVSFFLVQEAIFTGQILGENGDPLPKFRMRARVSGSEVVSNTHTVRDEQGAFELSGLNPGAWDFEFTADGYAPKILNSVVLLEGETTDQGELRMEQGAAAEGRVTGVNGRAVASALIRFEQVEQFNKTDKTYLELQARTDTNGDFRIPNLVPGKYEVIATHPKYAQPQPIPFTILDGPLTRCDITLQRPARLRLIVRDVDGNLVPGARVSLFRGDSPLESAERVLSAQGATGLTIPQGNGKSGILSMSDADSNSTAWNIPTNQTGELSWKRKEPGDWTLWVSGAGFYKYSVKLTLLAGKEVVHEARLEPLSEGDGARAKRDPEAGGDKKKGGKGNKKKKERNDKNEDGSDDGR